MSEHFRNTFDHARNLEGIVAPEHTAIFEDFDNCLLDSSALVRVLGDVATRYYEVNNGLADEYVAAILHRNGNEADPIETFERKLRVTINPQTLITQIAETAPYQEAEPSTSSGGTRQIILPGARDLFVLADESGYRQAILTATPHSERNQCIKLAAWFRVAGIDLAASIVAVRVQVRDKGGLEHATKTHFVANFYDDTGAYNIDAMQIKRLMPDGLLVDLPDEHWTHREQIERVIILDDKRENTQHPRGFTGRMTAVQIKRSADPSRPGELLPRVVDWIDQGTHGFDRLA